MRRLAELHGGNVHADSAGPGQGSEFVVRLPAEEAIGCQLSASPATRVPGPAMAEKTAVGCQPPADRKDGVALVGLTADSRQPTASADSYSNFRRVLVVDDNVDAAATLAELLEFWGHEVCVVHDGRLALEEANRYQPEVVLLDIGLPQMDGYEVARRLGEQAGRQRLRLVAVTGYGQEEDRRKALAAGFDDHLVKPVDPDALQQLLAATPQRS